MAETEKNAGRNHDTLNLYIDAAGVMLLFLDKQGIIREINRKGCEILGYDEDEILDKKFTDIFLPQAKKDQNQLAFLNYIAESNGTSGSPEFDITTKNGETRTILWQKSIIKGRNEEITGIIISGEDITAIKKLESLLELIRFAFDHSPDQIYFTDNKGEIVYSNSKALESFGIEPGSPVKTTISEINPEISGEAWGKLWSEIKAKGKIRFESVHMYRDGTQYPADTIAHLITHEGIEYACMISRDISEQKKSEDLLRRNEAYLQTLISTIPDLIWLKDKNCSYLACNRMFERFLGSKESEIIGKTDYDFVEREIAEFFHENDRRAIEAGKPTINEEWITFADDGNRAYLETIRMPMYNPDGTLMGVLGIGRDITHRKEMEDMLRNSETQLKKLNEDLKIIIDNAPAMIFYKDNRNNYIKANPAGARAFGLSTGEIEGKNGSELFPKFADMYYMNDLQVINSGKPRFGKIESFPSPTMENLWIRTDEIPLKEQNGHVYGILLFISDITEQKRNEDALKEVNRKLNLLSSITRHDILNQITGAAGYLEIIGLDHEIPEGTKTEEYLQKISKIIETIKRQITFTGYYKDLGEQAPIWFDVRVIIGKVSANLDLDGIELENDINDLEVFADPLFEKVIYNLIDNAIKHGKTLTQISFSIEKRPKEILIICTDNGTGVPDWAKEKIFKREYYQNSGLGLFLSGEILGITGLKIIENGHFGEGARFEIHVPDGKFRISSQLSDQISE